MGGPFDQLPPAQQAGILCTQADFQAFCAELENLPREMATESMAAETLRQRCAIASRRFLNTVPDARRRFEAIRTDFDAWRGKISKPR